MSRGSAELRCGGTFGRPCRVQGRCLAMFTSDNQQEKMKPAIGRYAEAAAQHYSAISAGKSALAKEADDELFRALKELRALPDKGITDLISLTSHVDVGVRVWAATHLLPYAESMAASILESACTQKGISAFDAKMVLYEWRAGRLVVP